MFSGFFYLAVLGYLSFVTSVAPSVASGSNCNNRQWACRDGSCISFDGKCDGVVDCQDQSDETHALCRNTECQPNWFRCTYGACVDGTAPCNGIQECADNSDELLPRCRNGIREEVGGRFKCHDGTTIPAEDRCDGVRDCADGSDEILDACADMVCPSYLFQCAYGACVDGDSECNNIQDCDDNSDEKDDLCNKNPPTSSPNTSKTTKPTTKPNPKGDCELPQYPDHGTDMPNASECVRQCHLKSHISITYTCVASGSSGTITRDCKEYEPNGTVASPKCNYPNYYAPTELSLMHCINGSWDYTPTCTPECGTVTSEGKQLVFNGYTAKHGEVPWHAGIYNKTYEQICGGSIISDTIIISAAHCFWDNFLGRAENASDYAVAVGKLYRSWNDSMDTAAQRFDVKELHIPVLFRGAATNYQDDLAILVLSGTIKYETYIRPVCLDFDVNRDRVQLAPGSMGKVAGWGVTENADASEVLKVIELPYVDVSTCIKESPPSFIAHITSDKICAGYKDAGSAVCQGDSGGGLAFPRSDGVTQRYYLRGIVSTSPNDGTFCNADTYTAFTYVIKHKDFIKEYWSSF